jgi:nitrogen-specific signal transduction histidine kinase/ActR/RegA family two-component response regulator
VGASKIARDIAERRRIETERAELLKREREARTRAEALSRAKDELLATVSHELRTPLNAIFGWARILQGTSLDEPARARALDAIVRNAYAQARLVEDLLDLSRITTGRMRLDFEHMDINKVIEAALDTVRPAAGTKNVTLALSLDRAIGKVLGAPDRLQQVLWNLVMNAVKFTPAGGRVEVTSRLAEDAIVIVVADTGEGIAPDVLPHVFEPFRQEDSSSTRPYGGLGLGLALVRHLVELHGGQVRAESPGKGKGATFTVSLPVGSVRGEGAGRDGDPVVRLTTLGGVRVLLVDDDEEFLDLAGVALRQAGADVRTAPAAFRAYDLINAWQPDVVLTDVAMPGEDGFMLLRVMQSTFSRRGVQVPVLAVTAYGTAETRARATEAGFARYLTKPVDPLELAAIVSEVVRAAC